jgi:hypothetical protein
VPTLQVPAPQVPTPQVPTPQVPTPKGTSVSVTVKFDIDFTTGEIKNGRLTYV